jgi:hypothetical protein
MYAPAIAGAFIGDRPVSSASRPGASPIAVDEPIDVERARNMIAGARSRVAGSSRLHLEQVRRARSKFARSTQRPFHRRWASQARGAPPVGSNASRITVPRLQTGVVRPYPLFFEDPVL